MKEKLEILIKRAIGREDGLEVTVPEQKEFGHFSTNAALKLAKELGKNPMVLAEDWAAAIKKEAPKEMIADVSVIKPGFINLKLAPDFIKSEGEKIYAGRKDFGRTKIGRGKKIIVEYSDPNIAKQMHVGHIRSTIIGDAIANIFEFSGYKVLRWNYIGDWGTQFGKLIAAYKLWGDKKVVEKEPIVELQKLYVKFHDEMKEKPELEGRGQEEFKKLEQGDRENRKLWEWFKKESLKEFQKIYKILGVDFDIWIGEAFYENKLKPLVDDLVRREVAKKSEGALVVSLDDRGLPPGLIQKSDGASLYLTRDIANLEYRREKYRPEEILYIVGNEQALHFEQLFAIKNILGWSDTKTEHIKFGTILGEKGKRFATREGRVIILSDLIEKIIDLAKEVVAKKNPQLSEKEKERVARVVGIGALKYGDLKENRHSDIVFDWERMLDFSGNSAPYLQYTYARIQGIKNKAGKASKPRFNFLEKEVEESLILKVAQFPEVVAKARRTFLTSELTEYLFELANLVNRFYETVPVGRENDRDKKNARLGLIDLAGTVLKNGLGLLGIEVLDKI